jgi:hypothetical protein
LEASEPTLEKIRKKPPIDISPRLGKTAQEVLKEANQARLQNFLQDLLTSYKQARLENTSYLGCKWLGVLPTKKDLSFADSEITKALRSRLFYSIKPPSLPYSSCGAIAALGHKDTYKGASRRWIARHDKIIGAFYRALSS